MRVKFTVLAAAATLAVATDPTVETTAEKTCPGAREWTDCGTLCEPTCADPVQICPSVCVEAVCQCPAGTVLLDPDSDAQRDACVPLEECAADAGRPSSAPTAPAPSFCCADMPWRRGRGDAAAATRIFRGDESDAARGIFGRDRRTPQVQQVGLRGPGLRQGPAEPVLGAGLGPV